jgi:steroid delta-isomerase-like uncharacterized protein
MANKDIIVALFEAWHARDLDMVRTMLTPDFEYFTEGSYNNSPETLCEFARTIWRGTPDEHVVFETIVDDGVTVAVEARTTGTHSGEISFDGIVLPASGRRLDIKTAYFFTFKDGLIHRWNEYGSFMHWAQQMGANVSITPGTKN